MALSRAKQLEELEPLIAMEFMKNGLSSHYLLLRGIYEEIRTTRYLVPRTRVPKSTEWVLRVLPQLSDDRFRSYTRMHRRSFGILCSMIEDHSVFQNHSSCAQVPVDQQLLVALAKLANDGSSSSVRPVASVHGVSEGHVVNCISRVVTALYDQKDRHVYWPVAERRARESQLVQQRSGLVGVVGSVDGTDIVLKDKPCGLIQ